MNKNICMLTFVMLQLTACLDPSWWSCCRKPCGPVNRHTPYAPSQVSTGEYATTDPMVTGVPIAAAATTEESSANTMPTVYDESYQEPVSPMEYESPYEEGQYASGEQFDYYDDVYEDAYPYDEYEGEYDYEEDDGYASIVAAEEEEESEEEAEEDPFADENQHIEEDVVPVEQERSQPPQELKTIYFAPGEDAIGEGQQDALESVAELMLELEDSDYRFRVEGHACDSGGSEEENKDLSRKRAEAVKEHIVSEGVDEDAIEIFSHGCLKKIVESGDRDEQAPNRRVEIFAFAP